MQKPLIITIEIACQGAYCAACTLYEQRGKGWRCRLFGTRLDHDTRLLRCSACLSAEHPTLAQRVRNRLRRQP